MNEIALLGQISLSLLLGFLIGVEREFQNKPAGMRTYMLIALSSTLFVIMGMKILEYFAKNVSNMDFQADPGRIIEAVVVGISFVGAGTVLKKKDTVKNLTTAASMLLVAAIGIAIALEQYVLACSVTVLVIFVNWILGVLENKMHNKVNEK